MSSATTTIIAVSIGLLVGLLIGIGIMLWRRTSQDSRREAQAQPEAPALPPGLVAVMEVLRQSAIVVGNGEQVLRAAGSAISYGFVRGTSLVHHDLLELVRKVQFDAEIRESEFELPRSWSRDRPLHIGVRVAQIDDLTLILLEDRTAARRVEEVRRDFVVNVSHELKTPVGGITLLAEAIADASDDPEAVQRFAGRMGQETQRLGRLVSEIIDLSRLQATDLFQDLVVVDVADCAAAAVDQTSLLVGNRSVTHSAKDERDQLRVYGDAELLTTAIRNLVANAIAYSADFTRVSVVTRRHLDMVEVAVSDQGAGIPAREQERIFERFYRVDEARSRATGGTGLGLSIVKHISANFGGDVTVWSQEGQGSTFTVRLPAATGDSDLGSAAPAADTRRTITAPAGEGRVASSTDTQPRDFYPSRREETP